MTADAYRRAATGEALARVASAIRAYARENGHMPTDITDKAGRPLLSWRVAILPYMYQADLYKQFKLGEPWDSPGNKAAASVIPKNYFDGGTVTGYPTTRVRRPVGPGTLFDPGRPLELPAAIPARWARTLAVVEAGEPTPWAKPDDLSIDPKAPPKLAGRYANVILAATHSNDQYPTGLALRPDLKPDDVRKLVSRDGEFSPAEFEALKLTTSPDDREYQDVARDLAFIADAAVRLQRLKFDLADVEARRQGRARHGDTAADAARVNTGLANAVQNLLGQLDHDPALKAHKDLRARHLRLAIELMERTAARSGPDEAKPFLDRARKELADIEGRK